MKDKIGNGSMPLRIGNLINTTVYGGPYYDVPVDYWGVKMAVEIEHPHMVSVPTRDFDVPKVSDLQAGIVKALMAMINEEDVYVGCMGGIGRTGIFLAALAKVQIEYRKSKHRAGRGEDPVLYVRKHFLPHAVETQQQMQYIEDFDVSVIVEWLNSTQYAMGAGGLTPARETSVREQLTGSVNGQRWKDRMVSPYTRIGNLPLTDADDPHIAIKKSKAALSEFLAEDNHRADWKQYHAGASGVSGFNELENTTPIMPVYDDHETIPADFDPLTHGYDSATEGFYFESALLKEIYSINNRIDEFQEDVDTLSDKHKKLCVELSEKFKAVTGALRILKKLTKQTWYERIRAALK